MKKLIETNPQTAIQNFNNSTCLFICYVYWCGLIPDTLQGWFRYYIIALDHKVIDEDGYVLDAEKLIFILTGRKVRVYKKEIKSLKEVVAKSPVMFSMNDGMAGHFGVVENCEIIFNPLKHSVNVEKGKPVSARIIEYV